MHVYVSSGGNMRSTAMGTPLMYTVSLAQPLLSLLWRNRQACLGCLYCSLNAVCTSSKHLCFPSPSLRPHNFVYIPSATQKESSLAQRVPANNLMVRVSSGDLWCCSHL